MALKFVHILTAILALGASAGLGILLEFYGDHAAHGGFVLRAIRQIVLMFVLPGYAAMAITGVWMASLSWSMRTPWIEAALVLWGLGLLCLVADIVVLKEQIGEFESRGPASLRYRRLSLRGRALGAGAGLVVVVILGLMVFKPALTWLS